MKSSDTRLYGLYKRAVDEALEAVGGNQAYIALVEDSDLIQIKYSKGDSDEKFLVLRTTQGVAGHVVRSGEPYLCSDAANDYFFEKAPGSEVKQEVAVPLAIDGKTRGLILVDSHGGGRFSSESVRSLQKVATTFISDAQSLLMTSIGKSSLDFQDLSRKTVDEALEETGGDQAYIAMVDNSEWLNIEYSRGDDEERFLVFSIHEGTAGYAVREGASYFCDDARTDKYYVLSSKRVKQEIVVPIIVDGDAQGVLLVNSFKMGVLTKKKLRLLEQLAARFAEKLKSLKSDYATLALLQRVALERHLGRKERDSIVSQGRLLQLRPRCVTVMFADLRNFSIVCSMLASRPLLISSFLSKYYQRMSDAIHDNGGAVDKFIGDGVMAIFGGLSEEDDSDVGARSAVKAAVEMRSAFQELREPFLAEVAFETGLALEATMGWGCAIHTAHVLFGFVETRDRLDLTAIGEGVNVASRIEDKFKEHEIRISHSTRLRLDDSVLTDELGLMKDGGKAYMVFEVIVPEEEEGADSHANGR